MPGGTIRLVRAAEVWPASPGARRRAWIDALLATLLSRDGAFEVADGSEAANAAGGDAVALHLHGEMTLSVACALDEVNQRFTPRRIFLFGDGLVPRSEADRLAADGHIVARGLPSPVWAAELVKALASQATTRVGKVVEPVLPDWRVLPQGSIADRDTPATLLVRTALGVGGREAGCGVTAFEGPLRTRHLDAVATEIRNLTGGSVETVEVVDPDPIHLAAGGGEQLLVLLEAAGNDARWILPLAAATGADPVTWRRLREAGLDVVRAALPAACARLCEALHAPVTPDGVGRSFDEAHSAGITTEMSLQVGGPGETDSDRRQAAGWLRDHAGSIATLVLRTYSPQPGSEMVSEPGRYGVWWPPGADLAGWADRSGNNLVSRAKHVSELAEVAHGLGIDVQTPGLAPVPDVRRHRRRILRRYDVAGGGVEYEAEAEKPREELVAANAEAADFSGAPKSAAAGPHLVEIELSAACNLRCIGCWCHSGLLSGDRHGELQRAQPLATARITELLDELAALGVREVQFSGSGEPLVNPDAAGIIGHASALGLRTTLVTNGTLLDPARVEALVTAGLDRVTVSLWAGDEATYDATHPGAGAGAFDRVSSGIRGLAALRARSGRPLVKTYHVISRVNSGGIEAMVRHGLELDVDQVEFQVVDLVPDTVGDLALGPAEVDAIAASLNRLKTWPEYTTHWLEEPHLRSDAPAVVWQEFEDFGRFLRLASFDGFVHLEGPHLRCPRGLADEAMRTIDDDVFELSFPRRVCSACSRQKRCFPDGAIGRLRVATLKVTGIGSFLRRARAALHDPTAIEAELVRTMPCVVGDLYSRIDYRGNVVACCKGSAAPLGNVSDATFASVWSSPPYETFRCNARTLAKDDPYFAPFGCLQSCDNLGMNLHALYSVSEKNENADDGR